MSTRGYKKYVLFVMALAYTVSMADQNLLYGLSQPMKEELGLYDTQLGFLEGFGFAALYSALSLPFAQWADKGNRAVITAISIALWGAAIAATLFVMTFWQLVIVRMIAAIGAAGCMPGTYSLVGDYWTEPAERKQAMSIYMSAGPLSALIGFALGGWLNQQFGWRASFPFLGLSGLVLAIVIWLTVTEPRTRVPIAPGAKAAASRQLAVVMRSLWHTPSTRNLILGLAIFATVVYGIASWCSPFLMRSHHMSTAESGIDVGNIMGVGGVLGTVLGGQASVRWFDKDELTQMRLIAVSVALLTPLFGLFLLLPDTYSALTALSVGIVMECVLLAPTFALLQRLAPTEVRATSMAIVMLLVNLIGMSAGPQVIGVASDVLRASLGADSLRYGMLIESLLALWAACHFWWVGQSVSTDLSVAHAGAQN